MRTTEPPHRGIPSAQIAAEIARAADRAAPEIEELRGRLFEGAAVAWEELAGWVGAHAGHPTEYTTTIENGTIIETHVETLAYAVPDSPWVMRVPTTRNGPLEELRILSESLASRFGWWPAHATVLICTGVLPPPVEAITTVRHRFPISNMGQPQPARSELAIEARAEQEPERLAELARRRRRTIEGLRSRRPASRDYERQIALVAFMDGRPTAGQAEWIVWNRRCREAGRPRSWRYADRRSFNGGVKRARAAVALSDVSSAPVG